MNKVPFDTAENRAAIFDEWIRVYEDFRREVEDSLDRANAALLDVATKLMETKIRTDTATEAKKFEEEGPKMAEAALKAIESINNVTD